MAASDTHLLSRWIDHRDADAFRLLVNRYAAMVYGICRRVLGGLGDAEGVAQECFESLVSLPKAPSAPFGAWLHRVALNRALDRRTAELRRREREERFGLEQTRETTARHEWDEVFGLVDEAVAGLPEESRAPLIACYLRGESHSAIAKTMGVPRRTVSFRINKSVEDIREALRKKGVTASATVLTGALTAGLADAAPQALAANLGKLALAGVKSPVKAAPVAGYSTVLYGLIQMGVLLMAKKAAIGLTAVVCLAFMGIYGAEHFQSRDLPTGVEREITVTAAAPGQPTTALAAEMTPPAAPPTETGPAIEAATASPAPIASISGIVVDTAGRPLPGMVVYAYKIIEKEASVEGEKCISDEESKFQLSLKEPGSYKLICWRAGVHPRVNSLISGTIFYPVMVIEVAGMNRYQVSGLSMTKR